KSNLIQNDEATAIIVQLFHDFGCEKDLIAQSYDGASVMAKILENKWEEFEQKKRTSDETFDTKTKYRQITFGCEKFRQTSV
ncbi:hypothetical protein L9F63_013133, partial [Diploptera punctata]